MQAEQPITTNNGTHPHKSKRRCLVCCLYRKAAHGFPDRTELVQTLECPVMKKENVYQLPPKRVWMVS